MVIPYKGKHKITIWPINSNPRETPKRIEIFSSKYMYMHIQTSTSHKNQKVETAQICINGYMGKQIVGYTGNAILFSHKK